MLPPTLRQAHVGVHTPGNSPAMAAEGLTKPEAAVADIFIPLQGPLGVRPKAPAVGAWQSPGYRGRDVHDWEAREYTDEWYGLRCDDLVVIDCDTEDAWHLWNDQSPGPLTWLRRTPRGIHFIYRWTPGSPTSPAAGVWPNVDIRAGRTSQIVYHAPGYHDITDRTYIQDFDPKWLPESFGTRPDHSSDDAWDEIPDGRGNNTMAAFAGAFRKQGMSAEKIAQCLGAVNKFCMTREPMSSQEIAQITMSVARYRAKPDIDIEVEE